MKFSKGDIVVPKEKQFPEGALVVDGRDSVGCCCWDEVAEWRLA